jgi:hypothetical protein
MTLSLRGRLFAGYAIVALIASIAFLQIAIPAQRRWLIDRSASSLERVAALAAREVGIRGDGSETVDWSARAADLGRTLGLRVTLVSRDGSVVGDSEVAGGRLETLSHPYQRPEARWLYHLRPVSRNPVHR